MAQQQFVVIGAGIAGSGDGGRVAAPRSDITVLEARCDADSGAGISIWPNALAALDQSDSATRSERLVAG